MNTVGGQPTGTNGVCERKERAAEGVVDELEVERVVGPLVEGVVGLLVEGVVGGLLLVECVVVEGVVEAVQLGS